MVFQYFSISLISLIYKKTFRIDSFPRKPVLEAHVCWLLDIYEWYLSLEQDSKRVRYYTGYKLLITIRLYNSPPPHRMWWITNNSSNLCVVSYALSSAKRFCD